MNQGQASNPRTGEVDFHFEMAGREQVEAIARRLRAAQPGWQTDHESRLAAMARWADALAERRDAMGRALTADTGRRLMSFLETDLMVARIRYWVERSPALLYPATGSTERRSHSAANVVYRHQQVPYPLVGVISPWNFPLTLSLADTIPALCAGCAVLLKPSEVTPRFAGVLRESVAAVPTLQAVFETVLGGGQTGQALIDNVDMLCFTGSVATGRKVAVQAAQNFIPACLELGGKDPAIVLADADLDAAADAILRSAAGSCGQACMSLERIYVHRAVFDDFLARLVERAQPLTTNAEDIHCGTLPPFIDPRQADKVRAQLEEALAAGATLHSGGAPENHGGGWWMRPTIITGVNHRMRLMREETFGPVLPLMPFDSDAEAIALGNDSDYGLSGSVFGEEEHAIAVAGQLLVGAVGINDASMTALIHDVEKQSFAHSGLGPSRMGDSGLLRFFRTRALMIQRDRPVPLSVMDEANLPR